MVVVIGVLKPREDPAKKNGPRQAGRKCYGRIFRRDGGRIVDAGMAAGTCHKPDDERSLWTVVMIGDLEPREGPAEKIIGPSPAGRKCDGRIFRRDGGRIVDAGMAAGTCHKPDDEGPYGGSS